MLFSKRYVLGHIAVGLIIATCLTASFWQFSRLSDRKDMNSTIKARMESSSVELGSFIGPDASEKEIEQAQYRSVQVQGSFDEGGEVFISGRFIDGEPGYNVVTPFYFYEKNGEFIVWVNRGWIKQPLGDEIVSGASIKSEITPEGGYEMERQITGLIRMNESKQLLSKTNSVEKSDPVSTRISTTLFGDLLGESKNDSVYPFWLQMDTQKLIGEKTKSTSDQETTYPIILEKPELTEKNHLSYAIQWIGFALIAAITWTLICKKAISSPKSRKKT